MRKLFSVAVAAVWLVTGWCTPPHASAQRPDGYDSPAEAAKNPDFLVQGEYAGANAAMQVIAVGNGEFDIVLFGGGLPGAGWDGVAPQRVDGTAETVRQIAASKGLQRVERQSPTLSAEPPPGAVVLFDGSQASLERHWMPGARRTVDGLLMQGAMSQDKFQDYTLHIEFRTPFEPKAEGQGRGNSGVYHQGRYETQVLDSFGLAGKNNETGGIYEVRDPDLNMCFPPLSWQTYDVDFTAPRFDDSGKKVADAKLTVRLNGVVVQRDVPVPGVTRAAPLPEEDAPGPIYLQDHGNPVRYRNIWVLPRDAAKDARRPLVPGFERFAIDDAQGGRLLISQLGCAACHSTDDPVLAPKAAPVLDLAGARIRPDHLLAIAGNAHQAKQGTTMPDLFHALSPAERQRTAAALASFLGSQGQLIDRPGDSAALQRGEQLYHTIGCVACHAPRRAGAGAGLEGTSVPLGDLAAKYTLDSLSKFLLNPHAIRAGGNMPRLVNALTEARDIACYLIGEQIIAPGSEQFQATVYHGTWDKLPKFEDLEPVKQGTTTGLDLGFAGRRDNFAMRFEAYLPITLAGDYTFHLASDDGSRLFVDDVEVVNVDGVHPKTERSGRRKLDAGVHRLRIEYFEGGGEEELTLEVEGPDLGRAPVAMLITSDPKGEIQRELIPSSFRPEPALVDQGRQIFASAGCASCHSLKQGEQAIPSSLKAKPLSQLQAGGCLAEKVPAGLPDYELTAQQRAAIRAALVEGSGKLDDAQWIHLQLAGKNCYACHARGTVGGPEATRDAWFTTKTPEMGNEGRVPPPLTGIGDKLRPEVIDEILADGAKDRPYMLTRMPSFGRGQLVALREKLVDVDRRGGDSRPLPSVDSDEGKQLIVAGRKLVGGDGLACIKCHTFGDKATPGIQAMNLLRMSERLREDWFHRYMLAPAEYRPGTRMPLSFPDGKSVLTSVFDGDADQQVRAMWLYLTLGKSARTPMGIDTEAIVLAAEERPVIYRNFIEGLSPRGIAVGYPERMNLAWDANTLALALLWKNDFIDASKHWVGRGPGFQGPLGDFVVKLETHAPLAQLNSVSEAWPTQPARLRGYQFLGYQLNATGQPTFSYQFGDVQVRDEPQPLVSTAGPQGFERRIRVSIAKATPGLVFRAATGNITAEAGDVYRIDGQVRIRVSGVPVEIVQVGDRQELRGRLPETGDVSITQTILW
jgi:mono/diheme cytochrome c family protein